MRLLPFLIIIAFSGMVWPVQAQSTLECAISPITTDSPAEANIAAWSPRWYRSADQELWASIHRYYAGDNKVGWRKPTGAALTVSGRRLDGVAAPLQARIPDGYHGNFQSSGLFFPSAGCWEITAQAGNSTLAFTTYVLPQAYNPMLGGAACDTLDTMTASSAVVLLGTVESTFADRFVDFAWYTIHADEIWQGQAHLARGERIEVLLDTSYEPALALGTPYLFFLWDRPGYHTRLLCPVAVVRDAEIFVEAEWGYLTTGQAIAALKTAVQQAHSQ